MATDESDEGSRLEMKSNSISGPSFSFDYLREDRLNLILLLPYKIPINFSSFNKVLEQWSQVESALFPKPWRPWSTVSLPLEAFSFTSSYSGKQSGNGKNKLSLFLPASFFFRGRGQVTTAPPHLCLGG